MMRRYCAQEGCISLKGGTTKLLSLEILLLNVDYGICGRTVYVHLHSQCIFAQRYNDNIIEVDFKTNLCLSEYKIFQKHFMLPLTVHIQVQIRVQNKILNLCSSYTYIHIKLRTRYVSSNNFLQQQTSNKSRYSFMFFKGLYLFQRSGPIIRLYTS